MIYNCVISGEDVVMFDFQDYLDWMLAGVNFEDDEDEKILEYDIVNEVRELLVNTRTHLAISQKELSEKTGISQANISKIENGHAVPTLPVLKRLADGMGKRLIVSFADEERDN